MTVNAVRQRENSSLSTVVKSTAAGMAGGYALKYLWTIQPQENSVSPKGLLNYWRKTTNRAEVALFKGYESRTAAQDVFIKMVESKAKEEFSHQNLAKKVKALGGEDSVAGKEFRGIIRRVDDMARQFTRDSIVAQRFMIKMKRPVVPFLVAGAGIGFLAGFANNVMKYDIDA